MDRPLKQSIEGTWRCEVKDMPHGGGFSYPVLCWSFVAANGFVGGTLETWAPHGLFVFKSRGEETKYDKLEDLLFSLIEFAWGEPPHLDDVFKDILETRSKMPVKSKEEAIKIFTDLRTKWLRLTDSWPKCGKCQAILDYIQHYASRGLAWNCPNCGAVCGECHTYTPLVSARIGKYLKCPNCGRTCDGE
ncbi:MAG: hypothetical protein V2B13_14405 [Pseudomonadota bacterium]